jgi:hypothetical protein
MLAFTFSSASACACACCLGWNGADRLTVWRTCSVCSRDASYCASNEDAFSNASPCHNRLVCVDAFQLTRWLFLDIGHV